jgi:MFS family permease/antitoxin (DNA-binding transcriptional repressor) of toxin-antitoxin stability system
MNPASVVRRRRSRTFDAVRAVFANHDLRHVELAYLLFIAARWGARLAILVFAFERGGAPETGLAAVIQLVPAAVVAPLASTVGDRIRRDRALLIGFSVQTAAAGGTAAALLWSAPIAVVYALTAVTAASMTITRPVVSAMFPQLARSPDELIAANVVAGSIHGAMVLVGPAVAGVLLGLGGAGLALAVFAGLLLGATLLSVGLEAHPLPASSSPRPVSEAAAGFRAVARHPDQRLVVGLLVGQSVIAGALDVLIVVIVLGLFGLPSSAAGYLSAARGAGGLLGGLWAFSLIGKPRLAAAMALGLVVFGFGTAALALAVVVALAAAFLVVVGSGYARADIAGRTLLLRVVPDEILTRVFGVLEGMNMAGLAAGGALAPLLVAALGVRSGTLVAGLLLPATVLILSPRIRALDRAVRIPEQELSILRSVDLFAPLANPMIEAVASRLRHVEVPPGAVIMRKGEPGNRFYVIADGEVEVTRDGRPVARLGPGAYFGEIALLRDVPRTATVTATTPTTLLVLERADFLEAVTGHPIAREAADVTIRERLPKGVDMSSEEGRPGP